MPVDIALHALGNPIQGNHPPAPMLPVISGQKGLAEGVNSNDIVVPHMGAVVSLTATAKLRVDIQATADAGSLDPANSAVVLATDQPRMFFLLKGNWTIKTAIYA